MRVLRTSILFAILLLGGIAMYGCERMDEPAGVVPTDKRVDAITENRDCDSEEVLLSNYLVEYRGREYADGETTFNYRVKGTGEWPFLRRFVLELPECAPELASYSPRFLAWVHQNYHTGFYGIEWFLWMAPNDTLGRDYSITFEGDVPEGVIQTAVKAHHSYEIGQISGPCAGFEIAGTVFVDPDESGTRDPGEDSGIQNVTVELIDDEGLVRCTTTDADGRFSFGRGAGNYTLVVNAETGSDDFNEELFAAFNVTTPTEIEVTVGPDSFGNDFGFQADTDDIIEEIENETWVTTGASVEFWANQIRSALVDPVGPSIYDAPTILGFIAMIEEMFLEDPFQFTEGNELQEALDILSDDPVEDIDQLRQELLATEFNDVSGLGLIEPPEMQPVLISWAEGLIVESQVGPPGLLTEVNLRNAVVIFEFMNSGGGGGVDE